MIDRTCEDTSYPDEDTNNPCCHILWKNQSIRCCEKTKDGEAKRSSNGIPVIDRKSHDPAWIGVPEYMFFFEFLYGEMRIQYKPEKVPIGDQKKMKCEYKTFIWYSGESKKSYKNNMIEKEDHEKQYCVISSHISQKSNSGIFIYFSPCRQIFRPTTFTLYFYFEHGEKYSENEYIESKHEKIMTVNISFSKKMTISSMILFFRWASSVSSSLSAWHSAVWVQEWWSLFLWDCYRRSRASVCLSFLFRQIR